MYEEILYVRGYFSHEEINGSPWKTPKAQDQKAISCNEHVAGMKLRKYSITDFFTDLTHGRFHIQLLDSTKRVAHDRTLVRQGMTHGVYQLQLRKNLRFF